jgi:hypothetical protein
LFFHTLSFTYR